MSKIAIIGNHNETRFLLEELFIQGYDKGIDVFSSHIANNAEIAFGDNILPLRDIASAHPEDYDLAVFVDDENIASSYIDKWLKAKIKVINAVLPNQDGCVNVGAAVTQPLVSVLQSVKSYDLKNVRLTAFIGADIAGQEGMSELYNHTRRILMNETPSGKQVFPKTPAFNVIPQVGSFIGEETEIEWLFNVGIKQEISADIKVHANCAIAPIFVGMGAFVSVETKLECEPEDIITKFKKTKGLLVVDSQKDGGYACPIDAQGDSNVFISRIRQDVTSDNAVGFWICGDYIKVAAHNLSEQIIKSLKKEKK